MGLLEHLIQLDTTILMALNSHHTSYWDAFFWLFTSKEVWLPFYLTIAYIIFKNHGTKGFVTLLAIALLITLCDRISSGFMKVFFERLRPSHDPLLQNIIHLVNEKRGGLYGFVSSHAANSFGLATFTSFLFRNTYYTWSVMVWASINAFSRIYIGVHFPGDILGGLTLGIILGYLIYELYLKFIPRYITVTYHNKRVLKTGLAGTFSQQNLLIFTLGIMTVTLLMSAKVLANNF